VEESDELINHAGKTLVEIQKSTKKIEQESSELTTMNQLQTVSAKQIAKILTDLINSQQKDTQSIRQLTRVTLDLGLLVDNLHTLVNRFQINEADAKKPAIKRYGRRADDKGQLIVTPNGKLKEIDEKDK